MAFFNKIVLMGNITREPTLKLLPSGTKICNLGLAVNSSYKNKSGEVVEDTMFIDVNTWGASAENCAKYLKKGNNVFVDGELKLESWSDAAGQKRYKHSVKADVVRFLTPKNTQEISSNVPQGSEFPPMEEDI